MTEEVLSESTLEDSKLAAEDEAKEIASQHQSAAEAIKKALGSFPNAPTEEQIQVLKKKFGRLYVSGFEDDEIYLWRTVRRSEYVAIQKEFAEKQTATMADVEEAIVKTCIVWQSDPNSLEEKGGSVTSLHEQIMTHSNFLDPGVASQLVVKL